MWLVPKSEYLYTEAYRSGCNELHSKSSRSLSGVTSQTLDTSGFFRFSTLFQNWISTVFLRFVYDFYTWSSISRKPAKPWKYSMEMYRSGRNEADSKSCFHFGSPNCRKASNHAGLRASSNCELGSVLSCCSSQFPRLEFCGKMAIMRAAIWQPLWEVCFGVP